MSKKFMALSLGAFALATPVFAQTSAPTNETIIVTGKRLDSDAPIIADAKARLSETPGAVAVVGVESYQDTYAQGFADTLKFVPGVFAAKKWGEDSRLSIRGSGVGNNSHNRGTFLAQDGVPFNEADGFGDFQLIDPLTARYTEVYKGGNALRFGGALLGGAINLVTPTGRTAMQDVLVRVEGGSFDTYRGHVQVAKVFGDWDVFAASTGISSNGFRDQSDQTGLHGTLSIGRRFGEERDVRLIIKGGNVDQEIPGSLNLSDALNDPTRSFASPNIANDYGRNMRAVRTSLQTHWRVNEGVVFEGGVYGIWKDLHHPIFQVIDQESRNFGAFGRFDMQGTLGGFKVDGFAGVLARFGDLDALQWVNVGSSEGAKTADSRQNSDAVDVFAEGRFWPTDNLALVAGGSYGWTSRDFINNLNQTRNQSKDFDWFAPRIGVLYQFDNGAQLYGNVTKSVEPPNLSALVPASGSPTFFPLEPQEAVTFEVGTRGRAGPITWDLSVYEAKLDGELLSYSVNPSLGIPATTFNADKTKHTGIEAALDWRINRFLSLRQAYTWSDFVFVDDLQYHGNRLPVVPEHVYQAQVKVQPFPGFYIAPNVTIVEAATFADFSNTKSAMMPDYAIWGLSAGWTVNDQIELFVDARNLGDEAYVSNVSSAVSATPASAIYWPGEGRSVFGGVRLIWGKRG